MLDEAGQQSPETDRCIRCDVPKPSNPDANKHGGVSLLQDGTCIVCEDYRREFGFYPDTGQQRLGDVA